MTLANNMPAEIFLFLEYPPQRVGDVPLSVFQCVCTPAQLEMYPVEAPDPAAAPPFFRSDTLELRFEKFQLAYASMIKVEDRIRGLIDALDKLDVWEDLGAVDIGEVVEESA